LDRVIREITVIDPLHPLRGERLALLSLSCSRGPNFIAAGLSDGRRRLIRRAATDLDQPAMIEPVVQRVSVRTLLPLARHLRRILAASQEEAPHVEPAQSCPRRTHPTRAALRMMGVRSTLRAYG